MLNSCIGFVIQTSGIIFFGFWLLHLSHLLYSLLYPFKSEQLMKSVRYRRRVHAVELIIVLLCGVLPSIIICCTSGYRYTGFRLSCLYIKPEVLFYTFVFPISIGATIGLCILLISLKILKVHRVSYMYIRTYLYACINAQKCVYMYMYSYVHA